MNAYGVQIRFQATDLAQIITTVSVELFVLTHRLL